MHHNCIMFVIILYLICAAMLLIIYKGGICTLACSSAQLPHHILTYLYSLFNNQAGQPTAPACSQFRRASSRQSVVSFSAVVVCHVVTIVTAHTEIASSAKFRYSYPWTTNRLVSPFISCRRYSTCCIIASLEELSSTSKEERKREGPSY